MKSKQIFFDANVADLALDEIMHNSYMTYAEYVIMERALPRVEDGLKPVQRRILYTMYDLGITPDKPYKKSARIVGEALGKYHPHGDTSVYDAMVRMSQEFVLRAPLVDGHGNFGSMDGDSAAAMRYTEARMSPLALELIRDINKDTVAFRPNFDDTEKEPDMLPARYPNLLVNGSSGIAVGLATNIPPHNLGEVIDGVICRIQNKDCTLDHIMEHIKGPDFPTGGYMLTSPELRTAYETGRGKILIRAKTHFEEQKNGKTLIVITQMPFEVKKAGMLEKILAITETKKELFAGIDDIRDESDREGVRGIIEIKKGHNPEKILNLLFKYTDMQTTFGINMMVIAEGAPKQLGIIPIIDYYIGHQKNVVTRRTRYDLERAEKREHILEGLMIAVKNIDEVIKIIKASKNTEDAKRNLMRAFTLTGVQAQAVLDMRLARLTNLEIEILEKEYAEVLALIKYLRSILNSEAKLMEVITKELTEIKEKYADKRRTKMISEKKAVVEVDEKEFIVAEECLIMLTRGQSLKRMKQKSLQKTGENADLEEKLMPALIIPTDTNSKLYIFTNKGNMYVVPTTSIPEARLKEGGKSLNSMVSGIEEGERIINIITQKDFNTDVIYFATKNGLVKGTEISEFEVKKSKIMACGLREGDELIYAKPNDKSLLNMLFITKKGMSINILKSDISIMGRSGKGVGAIKLGIKDCVMFAEEIYEAQDKKLVLITNLGYAKQTPVYEFEQQGRNGKGLKAFNLTGNIGTSIVGGVLTEGICAITVVLKNNDIFKITTDAIPTDMRNTKGEQVVLAIMGNDVVDVYKNIFEG